ncbi:putative quinol monooxygenase [Paraburkholderia sp. 22B1P]|uniref:putative quinol monooxygenase n=1 Tax=Paraburkholderia sp. 22B1P TaxID=3080498 RepID=UPI00308E7161|nr:putative quinol monooxygenase [Paraburkholderia sp. 22B1P]
MKSINTPTKTGIERGELTLVAFLRAKPGHVEELGRRLQDLVGPTRAESGCLNYDLHRSNDDPSVWMLYENWRTEKDLDAHFKTAYLEEFLSHLSEVLEGDMDIRRYAMTSSPAK